MGVLDLCRNRGAPVFRLGQLALFIGAFCSLVPGISQSKGVNVPALTVIMLGFVGFAFCCGLYFPSVSVLKGEFVPEAIRSTVYNLYRVPINAIVVIVLLCNITMTTVFIICFVLLAVAFCSMCFFRAPKALEGSLETGDYGTL